MSTEQPFATYFGCTCKSCGHAMKRRRGDVRLCPDCIRAGHAADAGRAERTAGRAHATTERAR